MPRCRCRIGVLLKLARVLQRDVVARVQDPLYAREAGEGASGLEEERRVIAGRMDVVIGRPHPAALRVELGGKVVAKAVPLVFSGPRHRQPPVPVGAARRHGGGLPGDVPVRVPADHVLGGRLPVAQLLQETGAVGDHVEAQPGQVPRASGLMHGRAHGVGEVVFRVPMEDRAVARELEFHGHGLAILHRNGLGDGAHLLPAVSPAHFPGVVRVHLLHVHVRLVGAHDGEPPRDAPVVPDGHPRQHRLGGPDGGPSGRVQVHHVAQRRVGHPPVRIVGHDHLAARGAAPVDGPVVAPRGSLARAEVQGHLRPHPFIIGREQRRTAHGVAEPRHAGPHRIRDQRQVNASRNHQLPPGRRSRLQVGFLGSQRGHARGQLKLAAHIPHRHRGLHAQQGCLGAPVLGYDAGEQELDGELTGLRRMIDVGVHPRSEGLQNASALGVVAGEFGVVEGAPELEQARDAVMFERLRTQHFGQPALAGPAVHFHLPEAVLSLDEALRKEEVVEVGRVDVRDAPGVAHHFDFALKPRKLDAAVDLRELGLRQLVEARGGPVGAGGDENESADRGSDREAAGMPNESRGLVRAHGFLHRSAFRSGRTALRNVGSPPQCCGKPQVATGRGAGKGAGY